MPLPKSEIVTTIKCAVCKQPKGPENGWYSVTADSYGAFWCLPMTEKTEVDSHVCGQDCVHKIVQLWLDEKNGG